MLRTRTWSGSRRTTSTVIISCKTFACLGNSCSFIASFGCFRSLRKYLSVIIAVTRWGHRFTSIFSASSGINSWCGFGLGGWWFCSSICWRNAATNRSRWYWTTMRTAMSTTRFTIWTTSAITETIHSTNFAQKQLHYNGFSPVTYKCLVFYQLLSSFFIYRAVPQYKKLNLV